MKRIQAACLEQTIHFQLKEDLEHNVASRAVREELEQYKAQLTRSNTDYVILEETVQDDDSIIIKIRKQYNQYDHSPYFA